MTIRTQLITLSALLVIAPAQAGIKEKIARWLPRATVVGTTSVLLKNTHASYKKEVKELNEIWNARDEQLEHDPEATKLVRDILAKNNALSTNIPQPLAVFHDIKNQDYVLNSDRWIGIPRGFKNLPFSVETGVLHEEGHSANRHYLKKNTAISASLGVS